MGYNIKFICAFLINIALLFSFAFAYPIQLKTYSWNYQNGAKVIYFTYNETCETLTPAQVYLELNDAITTWIAAIPSSHFYLVLPENALNEKGSFDPFSGQPSNFINEIFWTHDIPQQWINIANCQAAPAAPELINCLAADIGFYYYTPGNPQQSPYTWSNNQIGSDQIDVETVALHELGHAFGLDDMDINGYQNSVMWWDYSSGNPVVKRELSPYDIASIQTVYNFAVLPPTTSPPEIAFIREKRLLSIGITYQVLIWILSATRIYSSIAMAAMWTPGKICMFRHRQVKVMPPFRN